MSEITDRIAEHFRAIEKKVIEVPEWGLVLHCKPMTLADRQKLLPYAKGLELYARVIILKAQDATGKNIFQEEERFNLMVAADPDVVLRVGDEILSRPQGITGLGESLRPQAATLEPQTL